MTTTNGNITSLTSLIAGEVQRCFEGKAAHDGIFHFQIPDARNLLMRGLRYFLGDKATWQPEYDAVADWLTDNKGKGLLLYGGCGRGKTLIAQKILPVIFQHYLHKVLPCYTSRDLNERYAEVLQYRMVSVDDIGQEDNMKIYGTTHKYFSELVDEAERHSKLLILTTNLRKMIPRDEQGRPVATDSAPSLEGRYDIRTVSRLRLLTKDIPFVGDDLRGK